MLLALYDVNPARAQGVSYLTHSDERIRSLCFKVMTRIPSTIAMMLYIIKCIVYLSKEIRNSIFLNSSNNCCQASFVGVHSYYIQFQEDVSPYESGGTTMTA